MERKKKAKVRERESFLEEGMLELNLRDKNM